MEPQLLQPNHESFSASRSRNTQGATLMSTSPVPEEPAVPVATPMPPKSDTDQAVPRQSARWQNYITTIVVVLLIVAVLITITRNWNAWEGGKVEQVTDDAYIRGDLTPLSTKVAGI